MLRDRLGGVDAKSKSTPHVVAMACGLSADEYAGRHSMLPFTSFAVKSPLNVELPMPYWSISAVTETVYQTPVRLPTFCPDCASEQISLNSYST
jgi:hypothetical protein